MNYNELLLERYRTELKTISMLKKIKLNFQSYPIAWRKMPQAPTDGWMKKKEYSVIQPYLDLEDVDGPVIYYYEILNGNPVRIWTELFNYKGKGIRNCPRVKVFIDSKILYVGSETKSLARRTAEHMGLAHKDTGGLQLLHWAPQLGIKLCLHYSLIDKKYSDAIRHVEATIANYLNPVVGKREK